MPICTTAGPEKVLEKEAYMYIRKRRLVIQETEKSLQQQNYISPKFQYFLMSYGLAKRFNK